MQITILPLNSWNWNFLVKMKGLLISNVNKVYQGIYVLKCDYPDYFLDNPDYFPDNPDYYTNYPDFYFNYPDYFPNNPNYYPDNPDYYPDNPDNYPNDSDYFPNYYPDYSWPRESN